MLPAFIAKHRDEILARTRANAMRDAPRATPEEIERGVPLFLTQLSERLSESTSAAGSRADLKDSATMRAADLFRRGFTVGQVVNGYGEIYSIVTELSVERKVRITDAESKTFS